MNNIRMFMVIPSVGDHLERFTPNKNAIRQDSRESLCLAVRWNKIRSMDSVAHIIQCIVTFTSLVNQAKYIKSKKGRLFRKLFISGILKLVVLTVVTG